MASASLERSEPCGARPYPAMASGRAAPCRIHAARCAGDRGAHRGRPASGDKPRRTGLSELDGGADSHLAGECPTWESDTRRPRTTSPTRKPRPASRGYFLDAGSRGACLAVAVRRHGVPRLRAPDDALAAGRARRARRARRSRTSRPSSSSARGSSTSTRISSGCASEGKTVAEISLEPDFDWERAARETRRRRCAPASTSSTRRVARDDGWRGVADFLMRVETPSALGAWSYEALDTKLARHAKPAYILQLCFYSEQLGAHPGRRRRSRSTCCSAT